MPIKADKNLRAYYNEIDPYAAQWLRNLMDEGWITKGDVDERSIEDVRPNDLTGYDRVHFFAGIGVWDYALNQAGYGRNKAWTGSCPCQPFSAAGKGNGFADERHLWPAFHHLIRHHRPVAVFGEQVASKDGLAWLDLVQADLEGEGYAFGAVDTCAAGFGAPHIRQRLYWVADTTSEQYDRTRGIGAGRRFEYSDCSPVGRLADAEKRGRGKECADDGRITLGDRTQGLSAGHDSSGGDLRPSPTDGHWRDADWLLCRDGKWRPVEPGTSPLAHGAPNRVGRLRGYGNAIVAPQAAEFVKAYLSTINHR